MKSYAAFRRIPRTKQREYGLQFKGGMRSTVLVVLALIISGCGEFNSRERQPDPQCSLYAGAGVNVHIRYPAAENPQLFQIKIQDGTYLESGTAGYSQNPGLAYFSGAIERAGTYKVIVSHPNFATQEQTGIVVVQETCHVRGQIVEFSF